MGVAAPAAGRAMVGGEVGITCCPGAGGFGAADLTGAFGASEAVAGATGAAAAGEASAGFKGPATGRTARGAAGAAEISGRASAAGREETAGGVTAGFATGAAGLADFAALASASFAALARSAAASLSASSRKCFRTRSACELSRELECVFFSVMPSSGRNSIKALAFISSSRASSLMRICPASVIAYCFSSVSVGFGVPSSSDCSVLGSATDSSTGAASASCA